jgi:phosphohistidine swiveling domain-containing protein
MKVKNNMKKLKDIFLQHKWYMQGVSAHSLFIVTSAMSGFMLKKVIGVEYRHFLFRFTDDRAEMLYDVSDLEMIWNHLYKKICENNSYVAERKYQYDKAFDQALKLFGYIRNSDLSILSDEKIITLFHRVWGYQKKSVGIGHILEPISIIGSNVIQERIANEVNKTQNINKLMTQLFDSHTDSFVTREEDELLAISKAPANKQDKLLRKHLEKYYWIHNTYAVMNTASIETFRKRLEELLKDKSDKKNRAVINKEKLMKNIGLSDETKQLVRIFNYCTLWQDSRKENILQSLSAFDAIASEVARRAGIERNTFSCLGALEAKKLKKIDDVKVLSGQLKKRRRGCYCYLTRDSDFFVTGKEYEKIYAIQQATQYQDAKRDDREEIRGMVANMGTAKGKVKICTTLKSLDKFSEGMVLVAHMTRPEYTQAMKKSVAIITDEGGITSHASIVARELKKPCIIGTKIATQVLHDGDLVEVDANNGVVRILKRAER